MSKNEVIHCVHNGNRIGNRTQMSVFLLNCLFARLLATNAISLILVPCQPHACIGFYYYYGIVCVCTPVQEIRIPFTEAQQMHICLHYTNVHHNLFVVFVIYGAIIETHSIHVSNIIYSRWMHRQLGRKKLATVFVNHDFLFKRKIGENNFQHLITVWEHKLMKTSIVSISSLSQCMRFYSLTSRTANGIKRKEWNQQYTHGYFNEWREGEKNHTKKKKNDDH